MIHLNNITGSNTWGDEVIVIGIGTFYEMSEFPLGFSWFDVEARYEKQGIKMESLFALVQGPEKYEAYPLGKCSPIGVILDAYPMARYHMTEKFLLPLIEPHHVNEQKLLPPSRESTHERLAARLQNQQQEHPRYYRKYTRRTKGS